MCTETQTLTEKALSVPVRVLTFDQARNDPDFVTEFDAACAATFYHDYPAQEPGALETLQETIAERDGLIHFIRDEDNKIIGGGVLKHYEAGDYGEGTAPSTELRDMFISPKARNKGLGFALTRARIEAAVAHGGNVFSTLNRGANQLALYRRLFEEVAESQGAHIEDWRDDPTIESYAYAYIEDDEGGATIIFQGSTPNGPKSYDIAEIEANADKFSPMRSVVQEIAGNDPIIRKDFGGAVSRSIGLTAEQFNTLREKLGQDVQFEEELALDGEPMQLLSITVVRPQ